MLGPLISSKQMERVMSYIDIGRTGGAKLQLGGGRVGNVGYFVEPAVFSREYGAESDDAYTQTKAILVRF
jgi:acyl-CoA reductase-like NAD-dependent aldehyde dehydrogenase